jgi:hypothetical protein
MMRMKFMVAPIRRQVAGYLADSVSGALKIRVLFAAQIALNLH